MLLRIKNQTMPVKENSPAVRQIKQLFRGRKIVTAEQRGALIGEYGLFIGTRKGYAGICTLICEDKDNYLAFKTWLDKSINWDYTPKDKNI